MKSCFKKIQCALLLSLASNAYCGAMGDYSFYDGIYVGADIGVSDLNNAVTTYYPSSSQHLASTGLVGGALIGYDFTVPTLDRFKIGIEFLANAAALNASTRTNGQIGFTTQSRYNLAPRILPGFLFYDKVVGHLILGYTNANFTYQDTGHHGYLNKSTNQSGFQAGLGMKAELIQDFTLRADAVYSTYQSYSINGGTNNNLYSYQRYTNDPSTLEGNLILIYKFNL